MKKSIFSIVLLLMLCGCWDKSYIQNLQMIDVIGIDKEKNSKITKISLAVSSLDEAHQGGGKPSMDVVTSQGVSIADTLGKSDLKNGGLVFNQTRIYLLSKSFARENPTEHLLLMGRLAKSPLNATVAIYDGEVSELLAKKKTRGKTTANFLAVLLEQADASNYLPKETLFRFILGKEDIYCDPALPLIKTIGEDIQLNGMALFKDGSYSGIDLSPGMSKVVMLFKKGPKDGIFLFQEMEGESYELWIKKATRDIIVKTKDNKVSEIMLPLKIQVILSDAGNQTAALSPAKLESIEKAFTDQLNKQALQAIQTLQKANCDYLELAREIHAYHHKEWTQMKWKEEYPRLTIRPEIKLEILNSGVMN